MPLVIKWKFDGIVHFTFEKTSSRKGHDCIVYFKLFLIIPCIKKKVLVEKLSSWAKSHSQQANLPRARPLLKPLLFVSKVVK